MQIPHRCVHGLVVLAALLVPACSEADAPSAPPSPTVTPPDAEVVPTPVDEPGAQSGDSAVPTEAAPEDATPEEQPPATAAEPVESPTDNEPTEAATSESSDNVLSGAAVPPAPSHSSEHAAALAAARALRDGDDRFGAIKALRKAEAAHGDDAQLRLEAAWCFFEIAKQGFDDQADSFYVKSNLADAHVRVDQALRMEAALPTAIVLLARILRYEENPQEATSVLQEYLRDYGGDIDARRELGDLAWNARDFHTADTQYTLIAAAEQDDGAARLRATEAKQWIGAAGRDELHAGYLRAAFLLPNQDVPLRRLTMLYDGHAEKLTALDEVIAETPTNAWAYVWKSFLIKAGDVRKNADGSADVRVEPDANAALALAAKAAELAPDFPAVLVFLGAAQEAAGDIEAALGSYCQGLESAPPNSQWDASNAMDRILFGTLPSAFPESLRTRAYDAVLAQNPTEGRFANNAGFWYRDRGKDYEKSLHYYSAAVAAAPDDQDYINDCALIYLFHLRDRKELCYPMFVKVLRLVEEDGQPPVRGYWDALENLCKYYDELGQYESVVEVAEKRANPAAALGDRPYPSRRAAGYLVKARKELEKVK